MSIYSSEINQMVNKLLDKVTCTDVKKKILEKQELNIFNYIILKKIREKDGIIFTEILNDVDVNYDVLRNKIEELLIKGYIEKKVSKEDKRKKSLYITNLGQKEFIKFKFFIEEKINFTISDFSVNEEKAVLKFLSRVNQLTFI